MGFNLVAFMNRGKPLLPAALGKMVPAAPANYCVNLKPAPIRLPEVPKAGLGIGCSYNSHLMQLLDRGALFQLRPSRQIQA